MLPFRALRMVPCYLSLLIMSFEDTFLFEFLCDLAEDGNYLLNQVLHSQYLIFQTLVFLQQICDLLWAHVSNLFWFLLL